MPCESAPYASRRRRRTPAGNGGLVLCSSVASVPGACSERSRGLVEVFWPPYSLLLPPPRQQIGSNERLQIAVQHTVDVSDLRLGPVVFDHAVRLQHVGTNLR